MNAKRLKRGLRRIVGPHSFLDDPADVTAYAYDSSLQTARPDFVLFPRTTEQVAEIVRLLTREQIPYIARGAGTNLSGGSIAVKGGAVIALTRMKRILSIEPENHCARVEPGVTNLDLQEALGKYGHFFAPDPASQKVSTLGGNVAENSGGPHCLKYGVTTNHILGVKLVAPGGEIIELGGDTLDSPGYDLLGLFVGSEGTLGIATEIICRILPLPRTTRTMLAVYDSTEEASQSVSDIIAAGIVPATLEMMDNMVIRAVEESLHAGYPTEAAAVLIIEIDGISEGLDETVREIEGICRRNGVRDVRTARDEREREQLWAGRRGAFGAIARLFPNYSVSDGTVPRTKLPEVLRRVSEIGRKYDLEIGNVFHAGDGNLHPLLFFDSRDRDQLERVYRAGEEILEACIEAGGTISGEHGIGAEKIQAMPLVFGPGEIELMHRIKKALDPAGLCNPGKILPEPLMTANRPAEEPAGRNSALIADQQSFQGIPMYSPTNPAELAALVRQLGESKKSVVAVGARTLFPDLPLHGPPPQGMADAFVRTARMRSVVEHDAANLTVTAEAGLTIGELQEKLAKAGQFLPLDAPPQATLGGIVASALAGARRHIYGSVRDLVLGLRFVGADGQILNAGGKTVKNVAGYDFGKLLIGSWGKLGIIAEITFRLMPLPKGCGAFVAGFEEVERAYDAAAGIIGSGLDPALVVLMNARAVSTLADETAVPLPQMHCALVLGAEGFAPAVQRQLVEMERICRKSSAELSGRIDGNAYGSLLEAVTCLCYPFHNPKSFLSMRISVPCGETVDSLEKIRTVETKCGATSLVVAHVAGGTVYSHFSSGKEEVLSGAPERIVETLRMRLPHSNIIVLSVRADSGGNVPFVTGNRAPPAWLESIKRCFDPEGLLNPAIPQW